MMLKSMLTALALALASAAPAYADPPTDQIAGILADHAAKPITPDSLQSDFGQLATFVRHDGQGQTLFSDGGVQDGHVRHAQARFDTRVSQGGAFTIAFELGEEQDFTFAGLAAALERRLGTPDQVSDRAGALFRNWTFKTPPGRSLTIAESQASDNGDHVTIVELAQGR